MQLPFKMIMGFGGGGKDQPSQHIPVEAPDSLRSKQYARVVDLVSEGEIGGLVDGLRSVYLDNTPVQNADGSYNFQGVVLDTRVGTQAQGYIPGFPAAESEQAVGLEVKYATPVIQTITESDVTAARVTVSVPILTSQNTSNGDIYGTSVQIAIDVQGNGGGYVAQPLGKAWSQQDVTGDFTAPDGSYGIGLRVRASANVAAKVSFRVEYKTVAAGAWTTLTTATLNVVGRMVADVDVDGNPIQSTAYDPVSRDYRTEELPAGEYMVRVVYVSGAASIAAIGAYWLTNTYTDTISGKTTSKYQRSYHLSLSGTGPWDIRVRRLTADSVSSALQNKTFWDTYTRIIDNKLRYPNSALIALQIDAGNFTAIPRRGYDIHGLLVSVPSNYDPITRAYTGTWDGTFVTAWTDNPAWAFYDMLINNRYGLGKFLSASQIDKWALYTIAQYCDELVPDGLGGVMESRFTCNLYLQTQAEAYTVLQNMASIFRGIIFQVSGSVTAVQDSPADPVAQFTAANVIDGMFNYSGSSRKARHTVAMVSWNDPLDQYKQKIEYVEDAAGIAIYGVVQTQVVAMGCTSRGQAHRFGRALLYSERMETDVISFKVGLDGSTVTPGDVIQTLDPVRAGKRFGGRVVSATTSAITLDDAVVIESGKTYTLSCVLADGSLAESTVTNAAGSATVLTLSPALASAPLAMSIWVLAASDLVPELWRVVGVAESDKTQATITALAHNPDKYAAIEQNLILQSRPTSSLSYTQAPASNIVVTESLYQAAIGVVGVKALISWDGSATRYRVSYRVTDGNWIMAETTQNTIELLNLVAGIYEFAVVAVNQLGITSLPVTTTKTIYGKTLPPADVDSLSVTKVSGLALVSWAQSADLDVQVGGNIIIRHTPKTTGAAWEDGIIFEAFSGMSVNGTVPLITGTYMAKALDSSGNYSTTASTFVATEGMVTGFTTVATSTQHPAFTGAKTNIAAVDSLIKLDSTTTIDNMLTNMDTWGFIDSLGDIAASGTYEFDTYLDLTTVATRRFEAGITALSFEVNDTIDQRLTNIDTWESFDGGVVNDCDVTLYASTTNDDPAGTPTWGAWTPFMVSDFTCRAAKFKLEFASGQPLHNIQVSQLTVAVKVPA